MSNRAALAAVMPTMLEHEGAWRGIYRHLQPDGSVLDQHEAEIECAFPDEGPFAYIQRNHFLWADGREKRYELPGVLRGDRLWWDVPTFFGYAWEAGGGVLLLDLTRKDEPGASFTEAVIMAPNGRSRARTWHWFKGGELIRRTLCDETRLD